MRVQRSKLIHQFEINLHIINLRINTEPKNKPLSDFIFFFLPMTDFKKKFGDMGWGEVRVVLGKIVFIADEILRWYLSRGSIFSTMPYLRLHTSSFSIAIKIIAKY